MQQKKRPLNRAKKLSTKRKQPSGEQDDREFEMITKHMQKFDPKRWETSMAYKRQMDISTPRLYEPDASILEKLRRSNDIGLFVSDANDTVSIEPTENPDEKGSLGFIGIFA